MALATRCPNCGALFRVAADQLKSRGGMVRCGSCRRVFNAIGRLEYLDPRRVGVEETLEPLGGATPPPSERREAAPPPLAPPPARVPSRLRDAAARDKGGGLETVPALPPRPAESKSEHASAATPAPAAPAPPLAPEPQPEPSIPAKADERAAAVDAGQEATRPSPAAVPLDRFVALEQAHDAGAEEEDDGAWTLEDEPGFLRRQREAAQKSRAARIFFGAGCALLVPCLAIEAALLLRASVLVHFPQLRPALAALCAPLSCSVQWPMRPEMLAVISSDLEAQPGTPALEFDAVVRNRAAFPMALPSMELTITDSLNRPVARRIFSPADYLGDSAPADVDSRNMAPGEDLSIHLLFELRGVSAAGFVAYPFYP